MVLPHSPFYFHTVIDEIPNLLLIRKVMPTCNKVVVHKLTQEWAIDLLKLLCFEVEVAQESTLRVAELVAITAPRALNKKNLDLLRENVNYQPEKILIVSRSGSPRNDDYLERSLLAGIPEAELIDPSEMTASSQVKVFSQAKAIIGLHGGALTNTVWMHESGKLVEIFNHPYRTRDYEFVCQEIGQKYLALEALHSSVNTLIEQVKGFIYD
jgi:capsular polysaccharide biosynthesis protein